MSDNVARQKVKDLIIRKFEHMALEGESAFLHSYLMPLYLQVQILEQLEAINSILIFNDAIITQDIDEVESVEDDE